MDNLISRQAAIDAICIDWCYRKYSECPYFDNVGTDEKYCDGCDAVFILKDLPSAQPNVPDRNVGEMNDLISRKSLKQSIALSAILKDKKTLEQIIDEEPSIDAVKHGRWVKMSDVDGLYYCCSECGEELYRKWTFDIEFDLFPKKESIEKTIYCPNCGARMEQEDG